MEREVGQGMVTPGGGPSGAELKKLRRLIAAARDLRKRLRRFADKTILRPRIDCVLHDRISPAIDDLEDMLAEAEGEPAS
jgi:hypothetical protein